jgi:hypothetical protein
MELTVWAVRGARGWRGARDPGGGAELAAGVELVAPSMVSCCCSGVLLLLVAPSMASSWLPAGVELLADVLLLLSIDGGGCGSAREDEKRKKMICGAHASVIGERGCNEIYVVVYACSGPKSSPYVFLWETKNCNGTLQNR